jgi:type IV pilus assembly protein PilW
MHHAPSSVRGLTLVELLVAMALGLVITLAAVTALVISQQGFRSVDAASQVRDNARFASDIMRRVILQAGYLSPQFAIDRNHGFSLNNAVVSEPNIKGFNNATYLIDSEDSESLVTGTTNTVPTSSRGVNGSDMLVVRYQVGHTTAGGVADRSMINCLGNVETVTPANPDERLFSVFHISNTSSGEPALMCTWRNEATGNWQTQPLIEGVERLQILYGTHNVTANTAPTTLSSSTLTPAPDRYLRADQLVVTGNDAATNTNWSRVRSIRIGMVLRGLSGSAPTTANGPAIFPFGLAAFGSTNDPGTQPGTPNDGRLRQTVNFTVHLRNPQSTQ